MFDFWKLIATLRGLRVRVELQLLEISQKITQARWISTSQPGPISRPQHLLDEDSARFPTDSPKCTSDFHRKPALVLVTSDSASDDDNSTNAHVHCFSSSQLLAPPSPSRSDLSTVKSEVEDILSAGNLSTHSSGFAGVQCGCQNDTVRDAVQPHSNSVQPRSTLLDDLHEASIDWPRGGTNRYLPVDEFEQLITPDSIELELRTSEMKAVLGIPKPEMIQLIFERYAKLFAILVLCDLTQYIYDFVREDLDDEHLPFTKKDPRGLFSRIRHGDEIQCTKKWSLSSIRNFYSNQWALVVPIFKQSSRMEIIEHYELEDNQMMPFILDASEDPARIKRGGFGEVYEVVFHPAHLLSDVAKTLNPSFAVKRQIFRDKEAFDREVEMHKLLSGGRYHSHLAQLVATYEHGRRFHLIFPFAKCNLRSYWKETPCPDFSQLTVEWFLRQVKGLASAVQRIHGYRDTHHALGSVGHNEDPMAPNAIVLEGEQPYYARHGDIKAENILWSDEDSRDQDARFAAKGLLILADFGQMRHYKTSTKFRKLPNGIAESPAYAPPEAASFTACAQTSRAYDIWSLGCVFLEFTIWILCDWDELCRFTEARGETFYTNPESNASGQAGTDAVLNEHVQNCIANLHRKSRCSRFVHELLYLISRMLEVDPALRITSGQLNATLSDMGKKATKSDYLIEPRPSHALCCCQRINSCPAQGMPLPARPSVLKDMESSEQNRARVPPKYYWNLATDSATSRTRGRSSVAVERWARAVSTFHPHEA